MAYSSINQKFGNCNQCNATDVPIYKIGKTTICHQCNKTNKAHKQIKKQKEVSSIRSLINDKTNQETSLSYLIADLDSIFSKYIRLKYSNEYGITECYTSGVKMRYQEAQCGHFISRSNMTTRWLEANCRPQSEHDNCFLNGNIKVFAQKLEQEQKGITDWLQEQAREVLKLSQHELKGMILDYRMKLKLVESKLKK